MESATDREPCKTMGEVGTVGRKILEKKTIVNKCVLFSTIIYVKHSFYQKKKQ